MTRDQALQLLGGYAAGTLTDAERDALFAAALEHQEVFDALAREEPLREALADPATRDVLLAALEPASKPAPWWQWRPLIASIALAGMVLAAVAVWRASNRPAATVIVADAIQPKTIAPPPPIIESAPKPVEAKRTIPPPATRPARQDSRANQAQPKDEKAAGTLTTTAAPATPPPAKSEPAVLAGAAANQVVEQQPTAQSEGGNRPQLARQTKAADQLQVQGALQTPAPMVQQQQFRQSQETIEVHTGAALLDSAAKKIQPVSKEADSKTALPLTWTILQNDRELPPGTVLAGGDTIRLRISSPAQGIVSLIDSGKVIAAGQVSPGRPFETPPLPYTASGRRSLKLTFQMLGGIARPIEMEIALTYR